MMEEKLTYKSAMEEIENLVKLLEDNKLDVDELKEKVKRIAVLVAYCEEKLRVMEEEVKQALQSIVE